MLRRWILALSLGVLLFPSPSFAVFSDGMNAVDLIGEYEDPTVTPLVPLYTKGGSNDAPNAFGLSPYQAILDANGHRLFVAESSNQRVLIFNLTSENILSDYIADHVLGQPNFVSSNNSTAQNGMYSPQGLAYDSSRSRLFVSEYQNRRVSVFDVSSITNGENAINVLGQPNFLSSSTAVTQNGMGQAYGVAYDDANSRLFVSDFPNHRVLIYDVNTITDGQNATNVLGQPNFNSSITATTQNGMSSPCGIAYDSVSSRIFVADSSISRVVVYSVNTITNGQNATNVLGQPNFNSSITATAQNSMTVPRAVAYDASHNRLFVGDTNNKRVLIFMIDTMTQGMNATNVLGQPNFASNATAISQSGTYYPYGLSYDAAGQRLFVAELSGGRITIYDTRSITDGMNAMNVIGQYLDHTNPISPTFSKSGANDGPNSLGFNSGSMDNIAIDTVHHRLFLADCNNRRVLEYNLQADNSFIDKIPDHVIGQANFYSNVSATTQDTITSAANIAYDDVRERLFVADTNNKRVLIFNVTTITDGMNAVNVLGQPNFTGNSAAATQNGMSNPYGLAIDSANNRLFVADNGNNRVTSFDINSITDGINAINVLGQPNFTRNSAATTQNGMSQPYGLAVDLTRNRLFVAENGNNRVTSYDISTITNGQNAVNVLGQPNFTRSSTATTQNGINQPRGLAYDSAQSRLFLAEAVNNRIIIFNISLLVNGMNASNILGQPNFLSNGYSSTQNGLKNPAGITLSADASRLFVGETNNNRFTIFDVSTTVSTTTTVSSSLNPSTYGASVTLTATVSPSAATGNVTFKDGSTTLGTGTLSAGTATLSISSLSVGSHSLTAVYDGTSGYLTSTSDVLSQTVGKATTTVTLGASGNPVTTSATVTLSASVNPADATGQVSFMEGTTLLGIVDLSAGVASLTVGPLSQGIHTFVADYEGSSSYLTSSASLSVEAILPPPAVGGGSGRGVAATARSTTVTRFAAPAEPTAKVTPSPTVPPASLTPRAIARATEKARIQAILQRAAERRAARLAKRR